MARKKGGGSSKNGRDSNSQRLGVKRFGGQEVQAGEILVRQVELNSTPATTLVVVKITPFLPRLLVGFCSITVKTEPT